MSDANWSDASGLERGGAPLVGLALVGVLVAAAVAWLNWPDPATQALVLVTMTLCAVVLVQQRRLRRLRRALKQQARRRSQGPRALPSIDTAAPEGEAADSRSPVISSMLSECSEGDAASWPRGSTQLRVLVAEDHELNRQLLASLLHALGHEAHFAANGEQAVKAVQAHATHQPFDLVLMDLAMPVMDGVAAAEAMRALGERALATMPIVALTADDTPQSRARCVLAGMNDFLAKPVSAEDLAACLRRLFGDAAAAQGRLSGAATMSSPSVVDHAVLNEVLNSLPRERVLQLVQHFFEHAPAQLGELRAAARDARMHDLKVGAHGLRGAALNLGLNALAASAAALHDGASHLAAHEVALLLHRLEMQLEQSRVALLAMGLVSD